MPIKVNYRGLEKALRRDKKRRKRRRLDMTRDGDSVKLLDRIIVEKSRKDAKEEDNNNPVRER